MLLSTKAFTFNSTLATRKDIYNYKFIQKQTGYIFD